MGRFHAPTELSWKLLNVLGITDSIKLPECAPTGYIFTREIQVDHLKGKLFENTFSGMPCAARFQSTL
jgi:hypothetical protein